MKSEQQRTSKIINQLRNKYSKPNLSNNEETEFKKQSNCYICNVKTNTLKRDHCHLTGKYRGALCNECNQNLQSRNNKNKLVCVFHNLNYDGNFILANARKVFKGETIYNEENGKSWKDNDTIKIICTSEEKFIQFSIGNLTFIDSFKFLSTSLEKLVEGLKNKEDISNFKYTIQYFGLDMALNACRKGVYPYEWMNDITKFLEKEFPAYENFYSRVSCSNVKYEDYLWGKNMYYNVLKCKNMGDYHDFYLKTDVLLLADVFENFRTLSLNHFKLDAANYTTLPSMSYDALLINMKENSYYMMQIPDEETRLFYDEHKIGAVCQVFQNKHVKANNKYMKTYDKNIVSSYILYTDANNLYGWAMSQKLPYEIIGKVYVSLEKILSISNDADISYTVCCDLSYPKKVHNFLNGYVPGAVKRNVNETEISEFQKTTRGKNENGKSKNHDKSIKVICDLNEKNNYIVDYRLLKMFVSLGVKVDKINYVYKHKQAKIFEKYISKNTDARKLAKTDFEKDFYKLCNNAIYGKTIQDIMKQTDVKIGYDYEYAIKYFSKLTFTGTASYNNGLYQIHMEKEEITFNKPTYIGSTILDLSKLLMLDMHYNKFKKIWNNIELLYTDTDSLVYYIQADDVYQDMYINKDLFDLSDVKIEKFKDDTNKKVIGLPKDESNMIPITEWVALKSKLYSYLLEGDDTKHIKAKGITKGSVKKDLSHENFVNTLETNEELSLLQCRIQMFKRHVYTLEQEKVALSNYDDKMFRVNNDIAYSYGHYMHEELQKLGY